MNAHEQAAPALDCRAVGDVLGRVGERWSMQVIVALRPGPQRFNALRRAIGGISQQMLARTLKVLERDGMVERQVHATTPPQVEYALTALGASLSEPVRQLAEWAAQHMAAIEASRSRYDGA